MDVHSLSLTHSGSVGASGVKVSPVHIEDHIIITISYLLIHNLFTCCAHLLSHLLFESKAKFGKDKLQKIMIDILVTIHSCFVIYDRLTD